MHLNNRIINRKKLIQQTRMDPRTFIIAVIAVYSFLLPFIDFLITAQRESRPPDNIFMTKNFNVLKRTRNQTAGAARRIEA